MNIAMYGGSFDPPHLGHLNVVLHTLNTYPDIDYLFVVPCFQQTGKNLSDFNHRYEMSLRTFRDLPKVYVDDIERCLGGESLTLRTVRAFNVAYYNVKNFYLIVGQDTADKIPEWEGGKELLYLVKLLVAPRTNISSTEIRNQAKLGRIEHVTRSVADSIYRHDLYK